MILDMNAITLTLTQSIRINPFEIFEGTAHFTDHFNRLFKHLVTTALSVKISVDPIADVFHSARVTYKFSVQGLTCKFFIFSWLQATDFMDHPASDALPTLNNNYIPYNRSKNTSECFMNSSSVQNVLIGSNKSETYLERSIGFLIIGVIGILANAFVMLVLGSSVRIRGKIVNTLIIHQSFIDFLASVALVGTAHLSAGDQHGLEGIHADIYCFFVMGKWPLWFMMLTSSFSLMFINIERYISIVYPIFHHIKVTRKRVLMLLPIVWVLGLVEECLVASSFVSVDGACGVGPMYYHIRANFITLGYSFITLHFFVSVFLVMILYG